MMRSTVPILVLLLMVGCVKAADSPSAERALLDTNAAYDRALVNGNAAALNRIYTDDFQIIDDDADVHDKAAQIQFMTQQIDLLDAKTDDERVTLLGSDAALLTGRFTGRYRMDGKESDFIERYSSIWIRDGGEWRLKHEHSSVVPKQP